MQDGDSGRALAWVRAVAVPVSVALATVGLGIWTQYQQRTTEDQRVEALYVQLAIEVLSAEPLPDPDPTDDVDPNDERLPFLRWAFALLEASSPTAIPAELAALYQGDDADVPSLLPSPAPRFTCNEDSDGDGILDSFRFTEDFRGTFCDPPGSTNLLRLLCRVDTDGDGIGDSRPAGDDVVSCNLGGG